MPIFYRCIVLKIMRILRCIMPLQKFRRIPSLRSWRDACLRGSTIKTTFGCLVIILVLHCVIRFEQIREHGDYASLDIPVGENDRHKYPSLAPSSFETLPSHGELRMPRIIHQTWKNREIPRKLISWVQSWKKNNPGYEYWLWTDDSARALIAERHPQLLSMYDDYPEGIRRADALRYVILYEFGGVYADMDLESLQSMDPFLRKYACFVPQEPYEHPILYGNFEHLVINAIMGCRPKHPFFKLLIDNLPFHSHMWNVLDSTGPHFLTSIYRRYMTQNPNLSATNKDGVYLTPAEYFFPTIDPSKHFWFRIQCSKFDKLTALQQRACVGLKFGSSKRKPLNISLTDHHWIHTYLDFRISLKGPVDIKEVVPEFKIYKTQ